MGVIFVVGILLCWEKGGGRVLYIRNLGTVHAYRGVRDAAQHDGMIICRMDGDGSGV